MPNTKVSDPTTQSIVAPFIIKNIYKDATMFFP